MNTEVLLDWSASRSLEVRTEPDGILVVAHPSLSENEVAAACASMGDLGPVVHAAWRGAMGLAEVAAPTADPAT